MEERGGADGERAWGYMEGGGAVCLMVCGAQLCGMKLVSVSLDDVK
jgi:hypothetical protein